MQEGEASTRNQCRTDPANDVGQSYAVFMRVARSEPKVAGDEAEICTFETIPFAISERIWITLSRGHRALETAGIQPEFGAFVLTTSRLWVPYLIRGEDCHRDLGAFKMCSYLCCCSRCSRARHRRIRCSPTSN